MINLLDYTLEELNNIVVSLGEPKFRGKQLHNAILNGKGYNDNTVLPKSMLAKLQENGYQMQAVKIYKTFKSKDKTIKFLFKLNDDNLIEGVLMNHNYGRTLCVSTQVGCKMNCAFCASGLKFVRNLSAGEILGQIVAANAFVGGTVSEREITNIVLMGSGEPLDNFDNVVKFLRYVTAEDGFNFSVRNITLSTCGIPSKIEKLADLGLSINLAISLHAPNDAVRRTIMPVAKSFPIKSIIEAANHYYMMTNRKIYIEYTLIDGVNSDISQARELADLLRDLNCRVNLITLNDVKERGLKGVNASKTNSFMRELLKCGITATIRRSLGDDVDGACGQLRNKELSGEKSSFEVKADSIKFDKKPRNKASNTDSRNDRKHSSDNSKFKADKKSSFDKKSSRENSRNTRKLDTTKKQSRPSKKASSSKYISKKQYR